MTLEVLRRFDFEPDFQLKSGVIAQESNIKGSAQPQVLLKGSRYGVLQSVDPSTIPANWDQVKALICQSNADSLFSSKGLFRRFCNH